MTLLDALLLRAGYNSALVALGAALLGAGGGLIGTILLLRRRSMLSDAISHATFPGLVLAFLVAAATFGEGRVLPLLLLGSAASAALGAFAADAIAARTRLGEDAAIASVLASFFGLGLVLASWLQGLPIGGRAGLEQFLLGSAAGMLRHEAELVAAIAALSTLATLVLLKEWRLLCFDPAFARTQGWNVRALDRLLLGLLLVQIVAALQIVGLVLAVAIVVLPAVVARLWVERLAAMLAVAAVTGAFGGWLGVVISTSAPGLPTGAVIVLVLAASLLASLLFAPSRGLLVAALRRARLRRALRERGRATIGAARP
ncbi:MAG: metal ABC transporter permease [Geminicoccaceae bacterium]|nr:metal ABC transporter permease [Geminicoccaceae bacterium]